MRHANILNIPQNPKEILDFALANSYKFWVDEKGTLDNPSIFQRQSSKLSYEEAFKIIQENKPYWVIHFRNDSRFNSLELDYWEFGGCNIGNNEYGEVFIWIRVKPEIALQIFEKFNLQINEY
jgi:hypothetical protein